MPDDASTIIDVLSIWMVVTLRAEEETAHWQFGHDGCTAANTARSTGDAGGCEGLPPRPPVLACGKEKDQGPGGRLYLSPTLSRHPGAVSGG
jgi:hypothetical protein